MALAIGIPSLVGAQPEWRLVEDLRIGGEESKMTMFTDIRSVVAGPEGQIFVLERKPEEIRLFDRSGKFVSLVSRAGQGPGETLSANGMLVDGATIWANDPDNARWNAYSASDGKYLRQVTIPFNNFGYLWQGAFDAQGRINDPIYVATSRIDATSKAPISELRLRRVRTDGTVTDTVTPAPCLQRTTMVKSTFTGSNPGRGGMGMTIPFLSRSIWAIDGRGGYWCSPNDEYLLVHRAFGKPDTLHAIRVAYARLPVGEAEREREIDKAKKALSAYQIVDADYSLIPKLHPVFARFDVDDKGQLWARRVTRPGDPTRFDVYDTSGRQVAIVSTTIPLRTSTPLFIRGDDVYGQVLDNDEIPFVIRARIVRPNR